MMRYNVPDAGALTMEYSGTSIENGLCRYTWRFTGEALDGTVYKSWGTAPAHWSDAEIYALGCDAIAQEVENATGDDTGNVWSLAASDVWENVD